MSTRPSLAPAFCAMAAAVLALALAELALGPVAIPPGRVLLALAGGGDPAETAILWQSVCRACCSAAPSEPRWRCPGRCCRESCATRSPIPV